MRKMMKAAMLIALGGVALVGVGCAGNTDEATNVGAHSAQLNAHGKADNGPAFTYFEYWKTADPANKVKTPTRNWPAGVQGSFSEQPQHLSESTAYSYRVCGMDQGKNPICLSTRQFTTGVARSHLDYNASTGTWVFQDDPGVNSNLRVVGPNCGTFCYKSAFIESCAGQTCGSHIVASGGCDVIENQTGSGAFCAGEHPAVIKLGDLDDKASVADGSDGPLPATIDGGTGDDSLDASDDTNAVTLTGGPGRDTLSTGAGNDTINARSANFLDSDTDASISCGAGDDTVIADRSDPISAGQNGCDHVSKD